MNKQTNMISIVIFRVRCFFFVAEVIHLQLPTNYYNEENSREQKTKQKKTYIHIKFIRINEQKICNNEKLSIDC